MNKVPLVSAIFTVYNQCEFVRDALVGVLKQTYCPLEIIISDDGSTDGTKEVIEEIVRAYDGPHKLVVNYNQANKGICENFEFAFGLTHGELVLTFGGDDVSMPNRVEKIVEAWLASGRRSKVLASGGWLMDVDGRVIRDYGREVMDGAPVGAFNAYDRCVFDDFPRILPDLAAQTYEDSVYGLRAQFFAPAEYVDAQLVKYRIGSGVSTGGAWRKKAIRGARAVKASCEQLLIDLEWVKDRLDRQVYQDRKRACENRIKHEANYLNLLAGESFCVRWQALKNHGSSGVKEKVLGLILLLPRSIGDLVLRLK